MINDKGGLLSHSPVLPAIYPTGICLRTWKHASPVWGLTIEGKEPVLPKQEETVIGDILPALGG